jgi:hypothetical protein
MDSDEKVGSVSFAEAIPGYDSGLTVDDVLGLQSDALGLARDMVDYYKKRLKQYEDNDVSVSDYERLARWRSRWGVVRHDDRWRRVKEEPHG